MLTLKFGVWKKDENSFSGSFKLFGTKFMVFVDKPESVNPKAPAYQITIKQSDPDRQSS